jgi:PAS domain S-box-containing protein
MDRGKMKILLVEDNPGDARLIRVYLSEAGMAAFDLVHVDRLAEGIKRVREDGFDVVLLDLSLPDASGLETVKRMHAAAATCPIVVLTATDDESVALEALRVGAQDYLTKGRINGVLLTRAMRYAIERRRAEQALRESEERFRVLYASIIDAVLVHRVATDGRPGLIVEANDAAARLLGYSRAEMLTKSIADVSIPLPGPDPRSIATRLPSGRGALFELVFTAKDGRHVFAEVHAGSLAHDGKDAVLYVIRDVTERNRAEAVIAQKNAELAKLNDLKNQFLGMAAHDLRNPLTVVNMASSFLLDDASLALSAEQRHDFIRRINGNGEFMLKLINDLLDVAKIESGRLDLDLATGDLCNLIEENLTMNRMLAEKKGIRLVFTPECGVPPLRFDRGKVEQVLNNLISNALNYSARGTTVTVRAARMAGSAVVSVQDQGPGIPAEELDQLFKPFSRTSVQSTAGEKSTGLGLAISRKIVEGHGGRIWAESEVGRGSTFSFSLPGSPSGRAAPGMPSA